MTRFRALLFMLTAKDLFVRRHEFRRPRITRDGLWPHITFAWWTWDALPEAVGQRLEEQIDTIRTTPSRNDNPPLF